MKEKHDFVCDFELHACPETQSDHNRRQIEHDHHQQADEDRETGDEVLLLLNVRSLDPFVFRSRGVDLGSSLFTQYAQDGQVTASSNEDGWQEGRDAEKWEVVVARAPETITYDEILVRKMEISVGIDFTTGLITLRSYITLGFKIYNL